MSADQPDQETDDQETVEAAPHEVLDPEDFNQARRLRQIHQARERVQQAAANIYNGRDRNPYRETRIQFANAVAAYGMELGPLMRQTDYDEPLPEEIAELYDSWETYCANMGRTDWREDGVDTPGEFGGQLMFGYFNQFVASVGLGVDLDEGTDEWEIQV